MSMTLKQQQKNYLVSIQCENPANLINFMKKTYNTSFETIPIDHNEESIVVLYLYSRELFKYFYLIIFSKPFQIKPS